MFTLAQIKEALAKVKTGADFPRYVQEIIRLGVTKYTTYLDDGHSVYEGENSYQIKSDARHAPLRISDKSDGKMLEHYLKLHQQGQSDYSTICRQAAEAGVHNWVVNIKDMTCIYYNKTGEIMLSETIPGA